MPFSGGEVSEKGFPRGWEAAAEDLTSQRVFRVTQLLEAMTFRPFSWKRFSSDPDSKGSLDLRYAFHGGYIDTGSEWLLVPDGFVTLVDGATNFIERTDAGVVVVNQSEFSYDKHIPMAQIDARNGAFVPTSYIDSRPEIGGAPNLTEGGQITFQEIIGLILSSQVPFSAVQQFEALLRIRAGQVTSGTFGSQFQAPADYTFPRDLFVDRDAIVFGDTALLGLLNVLGITTLENQTRRGIRTLTAADTPYTLVATDWHLNVDISLGSVEVLIPDAAAHFAAGFTDQIHFKIIGEGFGEPFVTLTPSVEGQLIDGFDSAILRRNNLSFTLVSDGVGWFIQ